MTNPKFVGVLLLTLASLSAPSILHAQKIPLNSRATYLRTSSDPNAADAVPIDLGALGLNPGDTIALQVVGDFCYSIFFPGGCAVNEIPPFQVGGVFSSSTTLLSPDQLNRVPGAIASDGPAIITVPTLFGSLSTDISQDFSIGVAGRSPSYTLVTIPTGANYLFVAVGDSFYGDNDDPNADLALTISKTETLTFPAGTNVSQSAVFNGPATNPDATSFKFTVSQVTQPFTIHLAATTVSAPSSVSDVGTTEANGICESGQTSTTDFDCRFQQLFTFATDTSGNVSVPQCIPIPNNPGPGSHCVYYTVLDPPPTTSYSGPVYEYIAGNPNVPPSAPQPGYSTIPQMYDHSPELDDPDDQFARIITTYVNFAPNQVGADYGVGGKTNTFNTFVLAYPPSPPNYTFAWVAPLSRNSNTSASVKAGGTLPIKFTLFNGSAPVTNANTSPHQTGFAIVASPNPCPDTNGVRMPVTFPGGSPTSFVYGSAKQQYQVNIKANYPVGTYKVLITGDLLLQQQCANMTITK